MTHWALALVKGIRETHEVKKKSFDLGRSNPEVVGSIHRGQNIFFFTSGGSLIPFTRANAQWVIRGFN